MRKSISKIAESTAYTLFFYSFFFAIAFLCSKNIKFIDIGFYTFSSGLFFFVVALILEISEDEHSNKL